MLDGDIYRDSQDVDIGALYPWPLNPRKERSPETVEAIAKSIQAIGLLNPIIVRGNEVVAGVTRMLAMKQLGHSSIKAISIPANASDDVCLRIALTENTARNAMSTVETVAALRQLTDEGHTLQTAALVLGQPVANIRYIAQMSHLCDEAMTAFAKRKFDDDFAVELACLDVKRQKAVLRKLKEYEWNGKPSVDRLRALVSKNIVDGEDALFTKGEYLDAGGTIHEDLLGRVSYDLAPFLTAQRMAVKRIAESNQKDHAFVDVLELAEAGYRWRNDYVNVGPSKKDKRKAGMVFAIFPDGRVDTIENVVRLADQKAEQKEAKKREKLKAKAKEGEAPESADLARSIKQFVQDYAQAKARLATLKDIDIALAVILSSAFETWPVPRVPGSSPEWLTESEAFGDLTTETEERVNEMSGEVSRADLVAKFGEHGIEAVLALPRPKKLELLRVYAACMVNAARHDDDRIMAILKEAKIKPESFKLGARPCLSALTKAQLITEAGKLGIGLDASMSKEAMVTKLHAAIGEDAWQPAGLWTDAKPEPEPEPEEDDND